MDLIHSGSVKVFFGYHWVFGHAVSYKWELKLFPLNSLNQSTPVLVSKNCVLTTTFKHFYFDFYN